MPCKLMVEVMRKGVGDALKGTFQTTIQTPLRRKLHGRFIFDEQLCYHIFVFHKRGAGENHESSRCTKTESRD